MTVVTTPYGRPATEALARIVVETKAGDALAPVTVVVPSNFAGLVARRMLGSGDVGPAGIANVSFVTPFRLAELLSSGRLGDRRPLTNPVLGAAVRVALADNPRHFAAVAEHHATERALAQLTGELSNVSNAALDRVASASASAGSVIALHRSIQSLLSAFHDESDVAAAAARRTDLGVDPEHFGPIIWYLPAPMASPLQRLMRSLNQVGRLSAVVGLTGADDADQPVRDVCAAAGFDLELSVPESPIAAVTADRIVTVTDADEEVRAVVRSIVELADDGVDLDRIGVFHAAPDPYVRILQQQLGAAEIPFNGPSRTRLAESVPGRTILSALALPSERWRRDRVMALVSGGPLRVAGEPCRPSAWERLTRDIGVVGGLADWHSKIARRRHTLGSQLASDVEPRLADRIAREQADIDQMSHFIEATASRMQQLEAASGWAAKADEAKALLTDLLGPAHRHTAWPEAEQEAFERVEAAIERLATLDDIEPEPTHHVFLRAVTSELDVARGRSGRFGNGVVYGPLSSAVGHDLDAVFVLGCREGVLPAPRRDDAVLPDMARALASGELELRAGQLGEQHRQFLAALSAAPVGRRGIAMPRGDLRNSRESLASRWLLDTASELAGRPIRATDFAELAEGDGDGIVDNVASFRAGLASTRHHASLVERDLAAVAAHVAIGGDAIGHPAADLARRGIEASRARRSTAFTEWDGNLAGNEIGSTAEEPLSPTRLQTWASCGYRYFLAYTLGLAERDDPERLVDISPLDKGSGVHEVLERFIKELLDADEMPLPTQPWTSAHRARVTALAEEVFDEYEAKGRTGRPVRWRITRDELLILLDDFLDADDGHRLTRMATPVGVELPFGMREAPPVIIELSDGRSLRFRGMADRLDRGEDGRTFVTDYKTGKGKEYKGIDKGDPVREGTTLQLGLYAEAARQLLGADEVDAHYWLVNRAANHSRVGYPWTDDRRDRMVEVLTVIADGIEGGEFATNPGEWSSFRATNDNCSYCPFDSVCDRERGEHALAKEPSLTHRPGLVWADPADAADGDNNDRNEAGA